MQGKLTSVASILIILWFAFPGTAYSLKATTDISTYHKILGTKANEYYNQWRWLATNVMGLDNPGVSTGKRRRRFARVLDGTVFYMLSAFQKLTRGARFIELDENGARLYEKKCGYKQALEDFYSLKPVDVIDNPMGEGKVGRVTGLTIVVKERTEKIPSYISIAGKNIRIPQTIILYTGFDNS